MARIDFQQENLGDQSLYCLNVKSVSQSCCPYWPAKTGGEGEGELMCQQLFYWPASKQNLYAFHLLIGDTTPQNANNMSWVQTLENRHRSPSQVQGGRGGGVGEVDTPSLALCIMYTLTDLNFRLVTFFMQKESTRELVGGNFLDV